MPNALLALSRILANGLVNKNEVMIFYKTNTILITGITGFLGSHLVRELLHIGQYKIIGLKRTKSDTKRIDDIKYHKLLKIYDADNIEIEHLFKKYEIEVVIHTATDYGRNGTSTAKVLESNLILPIRLLEGAINGNVKLFINTDSYFNKDNMTYSYLLNYSLSKRSLLTWLKYFCKKIQIANVVLEHIYGENDSETKFVENMIQRIAIRNENHVGLTYGHQRRDFVYIKDVIEAYLKIMKYSENNQYRFNNYNVGMGKGMQIREFVCLIKELSNSKTQLDFGIIPYRDDEIMYSIADIVDLKNIGWNPQVTVEMGIKRIIEIYLSR